MSSLRQGLHQKLLQKLSPQQIQLMKLLQIPVASLEQRIKEEMQTRLWKKVQRLTKMNTLPMKMKRSTRMMTKN
jgi:hypothetical protein